LVNELADSDPEVYRAMKSGLDLINQEPDTPCTPEKGPSSRPDAGSLDSKNADDETKKKLVKVDVRYTRVETRSLTDEEFSILRSGLHWSPREVPLSVGNSALATLVDAEGTPLASMSITWIRVQPRTKESLSLGFFTVSLKNDSTCLFNTKAELFTKSEIVPVVNRFVWSSWVTLHEPSRGESSKITEITANLSKPYSALNFTPLDPEFALSQCRTPIP
jgi:hypothetical protein